METNTILICIGIGALIALIIALIWGVADKNKMITIRKAFEASRYVDGDLNLTISSDHFSHETTRVIHHEPPQNAGSNQQNINGLR